MDFNVEPFYDDFDATNGAKDENYMRILFRPGYAVQARELTQIQSILQNQLKNFGDHIFKDGSPVFGGQITLDTNAKYLKLQTTYNGVDIDAVDFANTVISNSVGNEKIRARVIAVDDTQTQPTLMVRYLRGNQFPNGNVITTGTDFAQLTADAASGSGPRSAIAGQRATARCRRHTSGAPSSTKGKTRHPAVHGRSCQPCGSLGLQTSAGKTSR